MEALAQLLPLVLIVAVFWLLLIRPTRKRQQELQATQSRVTTGTQVMLGAGIFGTVTAVHDDETLQVEVSPGASMKVARGAVARVVEDAPYADPDAPAGEPVVRPEHDGE